MAKISKHGGPSDKLTDPNLISGDNGEGDQPSVGNSSTQSSKSPEKSDGSTSISDRTPAPTTESPSEKDSTDATAPSTGGRRILSRRSS